MALRLRHIASATAVAEISSAIDMPNPITCPDETRLTILQEAAFIQAACEAADDIDLGFSAGLTYATPGTLPAYISRHAATLRDGLDLSCHYVKAVRPGMDFVLEERGNVASLRLTLSDPRLHDFPRHRECIFSGVTAQIRAFTKRAFYPDTLRFTHARMPVGSDVRARLGSPVEFAAEEIEMLMRLDILNAPMISSDSILEGLLVAQGDSQVDALGRPDPGIAEKVEMIIEAHFPMRLPSIDTIARELGMSRRTLSRKLEDAETSYQRILGHVRLRLAQRELRDTTLAIGEIAHRLRYSNQAAFSTAFKRDMGITPKEFRGGASPN